MRLSKRHLKRIIREEYSRLKRRGLLRESIHSHLDGELTNVVFAACQEVGEEYGDITVQDVVEHIASQNNDYLTTEVDPEHAEYFAEAIRNMDYNDILDRMHILVDMGELSGGYEDFFELAV